MVVARRRVQLHVLVYWYGSSEALSLQPVGGMEFFRGGLVV